MTFILHRLFNKTFNVILIITTPSATSVWCTVSVYYNLLKQDPIPLVDEFDYMDTLKEYLSTHLLCAFERTDTRGNYHMEMRHEFIVFKELLRMLHTVFNFTPYTPLTT